MVGAGIAGMLAALPRQNGYRVTLLEEKNRGGGLLGTTQTRFGIAEAAANSILASPAVITLCRELGVELVAVLSMYCLRSARWPAQKISANCSRDHERAEACCAHSGCESCRCTRPGRLGTSPSRQRWRGVSADAVCERHLRSTAVRGWGYCSFPETGCATRPEPNHNVAEKIHQGPPQSKERTRPHGRPNTEWAICCGWNVIWSATPQAVYEGVSISEPQRQPMSCWLRRRIESPNCSKIEYLSWLKTFSP